MKKGAVVRAPAAKAGGAIVSVAGLALDFSGGRGRGSVYRALLEELLDSPKDSVLRCTNDKARYTVGKAARAMGLKVAFARKDGNLYVKITHVGKPEAETAPAVGGEALHLAEQVDAFGHRQWADSTMLTALAGGPLVLKEVARKLGYSAPFHSTRGVGAACAEKLRDLERRGLVEIEDGCYRLKTAKR